jgi:hypothetical protein
MTTSFPSRNFDKIETGFSKNTSNTCHLGLSPFSCYMILNGSRYGIFKVNETNEANHNIKMVGASHLEKNVMHKSSHTFIYDELLTLIVALKVWFRCVI